MQIQVHNDSLTVIEHDYGMEEGHFWQRWFGETNREDSDYSAMQLGCFYGYTYHG